MILAAILKTLGNAAVVIAFWSLFGWVLYRALKKSEDRGRLISKWIITGVALTMLVILLPGAGRFSIMLGLIIGLILAITWARDVAMLVASPFGNMIDGGNDEVEATPFYSRAQGLRRRSQFHEAIAEVRVQLDKFPDDFAGQMLLAEINADDLQDLQSAEIIVHKILGQTQHAPGQIAAALQALADWQIKLGQDPDSARVTLGEIIERFPNSPVAQMAAQRIAHLGSVGSVLAAHDRPAMALKHFEMPDAMVNPISQAAPPRDAATRAADCLKQLEKHPQDSDAREELATIYAHDYQRPDLAAEELEQLISHPNHPPKKVARWLNLLVDLQIKICDDVPGATQTLRRIVEMYPQTVYADQAMLRLEYLRSEAKRHEKTRDIKLGTYEKDLGLKKPGV